jgi:hypothetical protein
MDACSYLLVDEMDQCDMGLNILLARYIYYIPGERMCC